MIIGKYFPKLFYGFKIVEYTLIGMTHFSNSETNMLDYMHPFDFTDTFSINENGEFNKKRKFHLSGQ